MSLHELAGKPAPRSFLVNVPRLVSAYYVLKPDPSDPGQRVAFGTSGHRGSSLTRQLQRGPHPRHEPGDRASTAARAGITGPLFLGMDTHALSEPALATALEVFAAHGVEVRIQAGRRYTPTPVISHAILTYNRGPQGATSPTASSSRPRTTRRRTAASSTTRPTAARPTPTSRRRSRRGPTRSWTAASRDVKRVALREGAARRDHARARLRGPYVDDLANVVDMDAIAGAKLRIGVDPAGRRRRSTTGAHRRALPASTSTSSTRVVDPTFSFMTARQGRQDPHGLLVALRDGGPDRPEGPLRRRLRQRRRRRPPRHRHAQRGPAEPEPLPRGRDRLPLPPPPRLARRRRGRQDARLELDDRPRGGATSAGGWPRCRSASSGSSTASLDGSFGFGGEESAGASFLRKDGTVWTTDKDGIILDLLACEITRGDRPGPGRALPRARGALRRPGLRADRRAGDAASRRPRSGSSRRRR